MQAVASRLTMGVRDALHRRRPDPAGSLLAVSDAALTLRTGLGIAFAGAAGLCVRPRATMAFDTGLTEALALAAAVAADAGAVAGREDDEHGCAWVVLRGPDPEVLAIAADAAAGTLAGGGQPGAPLCAAFAFSGGGNAGPLLLVFGVARRRWHPFASAPDRPDGRDHAAEEAVAGALRAELRIERERERWFALAGTPLST